MPESPASEDRDEIYDRVDHVMNGLRSMLPSSMGVGPLAMLTEIMRGMNRDISLVPVDQVQLFMRQIGQACYWIADGSMEDLNDAGDGGNSSQEG